MMKVRTVTIGKHCLGKLHGCPAELLETLEVVKPLMHKASSEAEYTIVGETFHQFEPVGVTGILLLSESHFSIHTWPEKNMAVIDIFTCGTEGDPKKGFEAIAKLLKAEKTEMEVIER